MDAGARAPHSADGVFEGGGVKGLALVGGLLEFADHGYTDWVNVAGTSAGAIVAAYLATGHSAEQAKALLEATDFATFEDFGRGGLLVGGIVDLLAHHGLAHGQVFHEWFNRAVGGQTFADIEKGGRTLKLIASDTTRHQMLVLPEDLAQFLDPRSGSPIDPGLTLVADAVRMSMSIPYFFTPITLVHGTTREACTIVDGGVVSNFPVWIFDVDRGRHAAHLRLPPGRRRGRRGRPPAGLRASPVGGRDGRGPLRDRERRLRHRVRHSLHGGAHLRG